MKEMNVEANLEMLDEVLAFVDAQLEEHSCAMNVQLQIDIAVEEIFVNICHYAYNPEIGTAVIRVEIQEDPLSVVMTFMDHGKPFDPLAKEDPDITLSAEEREIGGLGIFMVKKSMDDVRYEYKDGSNILTIRKSL